MTVACLRPLKIAMLVPEPLPCVRHLMSAVFDPNRARMMSVPGRLCP